MRPFARGLGVLSAALLVAACGGGGGGGSTTAPTTAGGGGATQAAAVCSQSDAAGTVKADVAEFKFQPETINAKVNDVISWTNGDSAPHGVALDDGNVECTKKIAGGSSGGTVFTKAGTYPFHCSVHSNMKGTIVIS